MPRRAGWCSREPTDMDAGTGVLVLGPWGHGSDISKRWLDDYLKSMPSNIPIRCIWRASGCAIQLARKNKVNVLLTPEEKSRSFEAVKKQFVDCAMILVWVPEQSSQAAGWQWVKRYMQDWRLPHSRDFVLLNGYCRDYHMFPADTGKVALELGSVGLGRRYCARHKRACWRFPVAY